MILFKNLLIRSEMLSKLVAIMRIKINVMWLLFFFMKVLRDVVLQKRSNKFNLFGIRRSSWIFVYFLSFLGLFYII